MSGGIDSYLPDDSQTQGFVFVVFFLVVLPATVILAQTAPYVLVLAVVLGFLAWLVERSGVLDGSTDGQAEEVDPVTTLQDRYARGEIDEAEFERRLDTLVEVEDLDLDEVADDREPAIERER